MLNNILKNVDLSSLPEKDQQLIRTWAADSYQLREFFTLDILPPWKIMHNMGIAIMHYLSDEDVHGGVDGVPRHVADQYIYMYRYLAYLMSQVEENPLPAE